jgi:hypothetical protein
MVRALAAAASGIDPFNWPALLTGLAGSMAAVLAWLGGRRGQDIERRDEKAGRVLEGRGQAFDQLDKVLNRLETENSRLLAAQKREADAHEQDKERWQTEIRVLRESCASQAAQLVDVITTLRDITRDEIAQSAAEDALSRVDEHEASGHTRALDRDGTVT